MCEALRAGKFAGLPLSVFPSGLLTAELYASYQAKYDAGCLRYNILMAPARTALESKLTAIAVEHLAILGNNPDYTRDDADKAYAELEVKQRPLLLEHATNTASIRGNYCTSLDALHLDCWQLFEDPANRADDWK